MLEAGIGMEPQPGSTSEKILENPAVAWPGSQEDRDPRAGQTADLQLQNLFLWVAQKVKGTVEEESGWQLRVGETSLDCSIEGSCRAGSLGEGQWGNGVLSSTQGRQGARKEMAEWGVTRNKLPLAGWLPHTYPRPQILDSWGAWALLKGGNFPYNSVKKPCFFFLPQWLCPANIQKRRKFELGLIYIVKCPF